MKYLGRFVALLLLILNLAFVLLLLLAAYSSYIRPASYPSLSCMGLTFPFFLFINLIFLCFWMVVQRYKSVLLPLAAILLCWSQLAAFLPFHSETPEEELPEKGFKILSYNVMGFNGCEKKEGKNAILEYLKGSGADILCLQEYATGKGIKQLTQRDIESALKEYPYRRIHLVGSRKGYTNRLACYSKHPILSAKEIAYPGRYNGSVIYRIKIGNDTVALVNNHLESNRLTKADKRIYEGMLEAPETEKVKSGSKQLLHKLAEASVVRSQQAEAIAKEIAGCGERHVVVCGDFNDTALSYTHRIIGKGLQDAFTESGSGLGISYNRNKFYFRIDHILAGKTLQTFNCRVDRSIKESDHYPITCYLSIVESPEFYVRSERPGGKATFNNRGLLNPWQCGDT
ncbi:MAG: endonuclease/exonuclease/phosphatase family protein [Bacteroides sp.]|nr:endonuclease/exonuclease/phosphatase family protein [Bacteroides sp.]